eukprot:scaffold176637_cov23-Tisochrysis_lutea.AAC.1
MTHFDAHTAARVPLITLLHYSPSVRSACPSVALENAWCIIPYMPYNTMMVLKVDKDHNDGASNEYQPLELDFQLQWCSSKEIKFDA